MIWSILLSIVRHAYEYVMSQIRMRHVTPMNESFHLCVCVCVCVCACRYESGEVAAADASFCSFLSDLRTRVLTKYTHRHVHTRTYALQRTAMHHNALQRNATHCNALQVAVSLSRSHVSDLRTASCSARCTVLQQHHESLHTHMRNVCK